MDTTELPRLMPSSRPWWSRPRPSALMPVIEVLVDITMLMPVIEALVDTTELPALMPSSRSSWTPPSCRY